MEVDAVGKGGGGEKREVFPLRAKRFVGAICFDSEKRCSGGGELGKIALGAFPYSFTHTCYHRSFTRGGEWLRVK